MSQKTFLPGFVARSMGMDVVRLELKEKDPGRIRVAFDRFSPSRGVREWLSVLLDSSTDSAGG